jgi:hypothetical protein
MKVFCCRNDQSYGGGLILVAANTKEEAFLTAAMNDELLYLFDWADDDGIWSEPDGDINHCSSDTYPLDKWFEAEHLSTDLTVSQVIIEDHHSE